MAAFGNEISVIKEAAVMYVKGSITLSQFSGVGSRTVSAFNSLGRAKISISVNPQTSRSVTIWKFEGGSGGDPDYELVILASDNHPAGCVMQYTDLRLIRGFRPPPA